MKYVREHINEKFTEESSDIIQDMGIGDPELAKVYKSLDIVNNMAQGEISDSFNLTEAFNHIHHLYNLIYLTVKFHVDEKFNLDLRLTERKLEYPAAVAFAKSDVPPYQFTFKLNNDTNEVYISLSYIYRMVRKHVETSRRCKTLEQLDKQLQRLITKHNIKITS